MLQITAHSQDGMKQLLDKHHIYDVHVGDLAQADGI